MWQHHNYWYSHRFTYPSSAFAHGRCRVPCNYRALIANYTDSSGVFRRSLAKNTGPYRDRGASVALQGVSGSTATVFIRWPYSLHTFDRVLRNPTSKREYSLVTKKTGVQSQGEKVELGSTAYQPKILRKFLTDTSSEQ